MERELIVERTKAGLAAERSRGRIGGGRPCLLSSTQQLQVKRLLDSSHRKNSWHYCMGSHWPASANIAQLTGMLEQAKIALMKNNSVILLHCWK